MAGNLKPAPISLTHSVTATLVDRPKGASVADSQGSLIDILLDVRAKLDSYNLTPFWACHSLLPSDRAISFNLNGVQYAGAHRLFWRKIERETGQDLLVARKTALRMRTAFPPFFGIEIHDLDLDREKRCAFFKAMAEVMSSTRGGGA